MVKLPQLKTMQAHCCAVRLCALVYFFAFLGNVIDGPIMWTLSPPHDWSAAGLVSLNKLALAPAAVAFFRPFGSKGGPSEAPKRIALFLNLFRPWYWPCLAICWVLWHTTHTNGGHWFFFGWDAMLDEIGCLASILSITLTLYDDVQVEPGVAEINLDRQEEEEEEEPALPGSAEGFASALRSRKRDKKQAPNEGTSPCYAEEAERPSRSAWQMLWISFSPEKCTSSSRPCSQAVDWCRTLAELSLTLAGFRLFLAAGLLKMRVGSACWKNYTCLYDHYETQPMPNFAAWMFHNYTPHAMLSVMQWFAIDVSECIVPYFLLSFVLSMGPVGVLQRQVLRDGFAQRILQIPGRLIASVLIMIFVFGMFIGGNYAFLHPLAVVSLVASVGTVHGRPVIRKPESAPKILYRALMPWVVLLVLLFAFLPSLRAYA
ncbi:unnamed protein product, partial [Durusdinium trenchii]